MAERLIGVDVGGTKVSVASLHGGKLDEPALQPTITASANALVDQLVAGIQAAGDAVAVGVAIPSIIDWEGGRARFSVNVPLKDVPLRDILRERLGVPVFVDNDATCAALAEAYDDDGHLLYRDLVAFTVGTGVGGGVVIGGKVHRGATGAAAELGHMIISLDTRDGVPPAREFPQLGSLEALAAGRVLDGMALQHGLRNGPEAVRRAQAGDADALALVTRLGERLGLGIANMINALDPEIVVIGGGVSAAGDLLLRPATEIARQYTITGGGTKTEIRLARYGRTAGVRGAALLAGLELAEEHGHDATEVLTG
ncbi:MAG: ROK family protein [Solirubrobacteraceae bacterium]|nr:ROK family protein [Solirubrobacteraceae bacterium]